MKAGTLFAICLFVFEIFLENAVSATGGGGHVQGPPVKSQTVASEPEQSGTPEKPFQIYLKDIGVVEVTEAPAEKRDPEELKVLALANKNQEITPELKDLIYKSMKTFVKNEKFAMSNNQQEIMEMICTLAGINIKKFNEKLEEYKRVSGNYLVLQPSVEEEGDVFYEKAMAILNSGNRKMDSVYQLFQFAADRGHKKARAKIAWGHLLGHNLPLDIPFARDEFIQLAEFGIPEAHTGLGFLYSLGIGFNVSQAKSLIHYNMAAYAGEPFAQLAIGYRYMYGINVRTSCEKSLKFYSQVAADVASKVTFSGGVLTNKIRLLEEHESPPGPETDLVEYYQLLADKGDVSSQVGLGQLYYQGGRATHQDSKKAFEYFLLAANSGNALGAAFLGKMYLDGNDFVKVDYEAAFRYFKKAADLGNPIGQSGLGIIYLNGYGVGRDTQKAFTYFNQAADQGWFDGQLQLGLMYYHGDGVAQDYKQALKYFIVASSHILANYYVGVMHSKGLAAPRSCAAALELFKSVAERGRHSIMLTDAYRDYKNYKTNEAFMQYAFLAEIGSDVSQSNAAFILDKSDVTLFGDRREDFLRAFNYWKRSAAQGYAVAQLKLGDYYYYGNGIEADFKAAADLYSKAGEFNFNAQALFNLGYMHENGLGMRKDWHLAKRMYDLAAETNVDAKIPVALALMKLQFLVQVEAIRNSPFKFILHLDENIIANWDLYLITVLTLLLGFIMYTRRPFQNDENGNEEQPTTDHSDSTNSTSTENTENTETSDTTTEQSTEPSENNDSNTETAAAATQPAAPAPNHPADVPQ